MKDAYRAYEVASLFGVSKSTVSNWISSGALPTFTIGECVFIPGSYINEKVEYTSGKLIIKDEKEEYRKWFSTLSADEKIKELAKLAVS